MGEDLVEGGGELGLKGGGFRPGGEGHRRSQVGKGEALPAGLGSTRTHSRGTYTFLH